MNLKAVLSPSLSSPYDPRFVLINTETGEIIDDAQGYGYKSAQKAHAAGAYKFRDKSKDEEKAEKERTIAKWLKEHSDFNHLLEIIAFEMLKGCYGPNESLNTKLVRELLQKNGFSDLPFTASELLKYWKYGPKFSKKKKKKKRKTEQSLKR